MNQGIPKSAQDVLGRQAAPQEHPSTDLLNGFVEQALSAAEKEQVTTHLAACAECREVVFLAGSGDEVPAPATLEQPLPAEVRGWFSWKWFVPAVAALAIAAGVTLQRESSKQYLPVKNDTSAMNAPSAAPQARMDEELSDKAVQIGQDAARQSKPGARQPEQEAAKKYATGEQQKQAFNALAQPSGAAKPQAPVTAAEVAQLSASARDEKDSLHARSLPSFTSNAAAPPPVMQSKNEAPKLAAKSMPSAGIPPPQPPTAAKPQSASPGDSTAIGGSLPDAFYSSVPVPTASQSKNEAQTLAAKSAPAALPPPPAADSSAKVLSKSKAAKEAAGPSEVAAARQNQQAVQQQQTTVDSAAVGGSLPATSSLIEGNPVRVRFSDWRITGDGHLERGSSSGEWTRVLADQSTYFQTVAQVGSDVWAGADDGTLFHSSDGGENWSKVRVSPDEHRPIVSIRFRTASEGTVSTDLNTTWKTSDGGHSWSKQ